MKNETASMSTQLEELDSKYSSGEKKCKNLLEQVEELTEQLAEETRAKIAANNKLKQLQDEVDRLNAQIEDEEEAKDGLQTKLVAMNSQVRGKEKEHSLEFASKKCSLHIHYSLLMPRSVVTRHKWK